MRTDVLVLPDPLARSVQPVGADDAHGEEVVGRAEAARGDVALVGWDRGSVFLFVGCFFVLFFESGGDGMGTDLVLHGCVAAGWGEVLTHGFEDWRWGGGLAVVVGDRGK